jgi:hypothetical protein
MMHYLELCNQLGGVARDFLCPSRENVALTSVLPTFIHKSHPKMSAKSGLAYLKGKVHRKKKPSVVPGPSNASDQPGPEPAAPSVVPESTPISDQSEPEADVDITQEEPEICRISLLWEEAYKELKNEDHDLMVHYEEAAAKALGFQKLDSDDARCIQQMGEVVKVKRKEVEGAWKTNFRGHEFAVKDFVEPLTSFLLWSKDAIGDAIGMASYPPASLAWVGACLLLPVGYLGPHNLMLADHFIIACAQSHRPRS